MSSKALLIVEGKGREDVFFKTLSKAFGFDIEIVPFCGNVSMLYDEMAKDNFMSDIKSILLSKLQPWDAANIAKLKDSYSDIILVFDFDPQHSIKQLPGETPEDAVRRNVERIYAKAKKMAEDLNNSTDSTRGQLYINYPSIESFRDADDFFDPQYETKDVGLVELCKKLGGSGYKAISARGALTNKKRLTAFEASDFESLAKMNAYKLRKIVEGVWSAFTYDKFREESRQNIVLDRQKSVIDASLRLSILNTSLYFIFDYKGRSAYESICFPKASQ